MWLKEDTLSAQVESHFPNYSWQAAPQFDEVMTVPQNAILKPRLNGLPLIISDIRLSDWESEPVVFEVSRAGEWWEHRWSPALNPHQFTRCQWGQSLSYFTQSEPYTSHLKVREPTVETEEPCSYAFTPIQLSQDKLSSIWPPSSHLLQSWEGRRKGGGAWVSPGPLLCLISRCLNSLWRPH